MLDLTTSKATDFGKSLDIVLNMPKEEYEAFWNQLRRTQISGEICKCYYTSWENSSRYFCFLIASVDLSVTTTSEEEELYANVGVKDTVCVVLETHTNAKDALSSTQASLGEAFSVIGLETLPTACTYVDLVQQSELFPHFVVVNFHLNLKLI